MVVYLRQSRSNYNSDDVENGDLIHTSDDKENISKGTEIVAIWNVTKQNYYLKNKIKLRKRGFFIKGHPLKF